MQIAVVRRRNPVLRKHNMTGAFVAAAEICVSKHSEKSNVILGCLLPWKPVVRYSQQWA